MSDLIALINRDELTILSVHTNGRGSVKLPDGTLVAPATAGWAMDKFSLVPIIPHEPAPEGKYIVNIERSIVNGQVVEIATYEDIPEDPIPSEVSRRQFKMQLALSELTSIVEDWVAQQDPLIQIAYNESGSFKRDEPMMLAGFTQLGFTETEIDNFFIAASQL